MDSHKNQTSKNSSQAAPRPCGGQLQLSFVASCRVNLNPVQRVEPISQSSSLSPGHNKSASVQIIKVTRPDPVAKPGELWTELESDVKSQLLKSGKFHVQLSTKCNNSASTSNSTFLWGKPDASFYLTNLCTDMRDLVCMCSASVHPAHDVVSTV